MENKRIKSAKLNSRNTLYLRGCPKNRKDSKD
jgi:hypothetical protein